MYWAFFNSRMMTLTLLVLAGAHLTLKDVTNKYPANLRIKRDQKFMKWLTAFLSNPRSLQDCARQTIRKVVCISAQGKSIMTPVAQLSLPEKLKDYLLFDTDELSSFTSGVTNS